MSQSTNYEENWNYIPKKTNNKTKPTMKKKFNVGKELANGACLFCINNRCSRHSKNEFQYMKPILHVLKNPLFVSQNVKKQIVTQVTRKMKKLGINKPLHFTNSNNGYTTDNSRCQYIKKGLFFKITINGEEYTVCYKDPKYCQKKLLVFINANYEYDNGKISICLPYDAAKEKIKQEKKKLVVNNTNFPSVNKTEVEPIC